MSLSEYFTEAQTAIAEQVGATGNVLYNGTTYTGVFGQPQPEQQMLPSGGYRGRTTITLTMTRAQFTVAPAVRGSVTAGGVTYRIESVDTHDPFHYVLKLIRAGE